MQELSTIVGFRLSCVVNTFFGVHSLVASLFRGRTLESAPECHDSNNQPAAHLANKHLRRLEHWLVEEGALSRIVIGAAIANALIVLKREVVSARRAYATVLVSSYLILGQQGIANTCE
jgi:hypothetical protein